MRADRITGIHRTETGWRAFIRVRGRLYSRRFPPQATLSEMKGWRNSLVARSLTGQPMVLSGQNLAGDVRDYLDQVRTMPTLQWRKNDLARWVRYFGAERDRHTITAGEVRAALERWRAEGYAASTVNHRRTALMHLFTVLDGRSAANPARDVPRYRDAPRPPRALTPQAITALLEAMPTSVTKARLGLMAWTGWPHAQIRRLEPGDIDWKRAVYIRPRRKGRGIDGRWLPLLPQGWRALREFKRMGAWGTFSTSSMRKSLRLAASKVADDTDQPEVIRKAVADITPYDLRHSFLTLIALIGKDDRAVQELGLHSDLRQGQRYTGAAVDPRVQAAMAKVTRALPLGQARKKNGGFQGI